MACFGWWQASDPNSASHAAFVHSALHVSCTYTHFAQVVVKDNSPGTVAMMQTCQVVHSLIQLGHADDSDSEVLILQPQWQALNQRLRDNGFSGVELATHVQQGSSPMPSHRQLFEALDTVLKQYDRRAHLVQELLAATDLARKRETNVDAMLSHLRRYIVQCIHHSLCLHEHVMTFARDGPVLHTQAFLAI